MKSTTLIPAALAVLLGGMGPAHADPIYVDFSLYATGTPVSSVSGITLSLGGGPGPTGTPATNYGGLTNSVTGDYPTANVLNFSFASPVSGVTFAFDNLGDGTPGGRGDSFFQAFDSNGKLLESGSLNGASQTDFTLASSGIRDIKFNNGTGGTGSWVFAVDSIGATSAVQAVPEPSSLALLAVGVAGAAGYRWRRGRPATA